MHEEAGFSPEDLEIVALPEREAMGKIKVGPVNNNLSPRGNSSFIDFDAIVKILSL